MLIQPIMCPCCKPYKVKVVRNLWNCFRHVSGAAPCLHPPVAEDLGAGAGIKLSTVAQEGGHGSLVTTSILQEERSRNETCIPSKSSSAYLEADSCSILTLFREVPMLLFMLQSP
jgi:hypothetical protein